MALQVTPTAPFELPMSHSSAPSRIPLPQCGVGPHVGVGVGVAVRVGVGVMVGVGVTVFVGVGVSVAVAVAVTVGVGVAVTVTVGVGVRVGVRVGVGVVVAVGVGVAISSSVSVPGNVRRPRPGRPDAAFTAELVEYGMQNRAASVGVEPATPTAETVLGKHSRGLTTEQVPRMLHDPPGHWMLGISGRHGSLSRVPPLQNPKQSD
jgi:hypothetical protein